MEGNLESGIFLVIFRITIFLTQENDGRAIWRYIDRYKGTHYRCVCLSDDRRGKMEQYPDYNWKMSANGHIGRTTGLQGVAKLSGIPKLCL